MLRPFSVYPFLDILPSSVHSAPIPPRPALPVLSKGIPIDVDIVWKACSLPPQGCYQCRKANHLVKDCPHCLDIQKLTVEQQEELIEDLMTLKDVVEKEEVSSILEEDFV